mgnify:CR=1 FL=1
MWFNGKHLSLEDRKIIENNINKGLRKFEIAKELNKAQSTIGKKIQNIDTLKLMILLLCVIILKNVKFVLPNAKIRTINFLFCFF